MYVPTITTFGTTGVFRGATEGTTEFALVFVQTGLKMTVNGIATSGVEAALDRACVGADGGPGRGKGDKSQKGYEHEASHC